MTREEWFRICSEIVDRMKEYVRPFVVPLSKETKQDVRLIGTGTFVKRAGVTEIVTCEHVARNAPLNFRPHGGRNVYGYTGAWKCFVEPIDVSYSTDLLAEPAPPAKAVRPH